MSLNLNVNEEDLKKIFLFLKEKNYHWLPQTPDKLIQYRSNPTNFSQFDKLFGLGLEVKIEEFESNPDLIFINELVNKKYLIEKIPLGCVITDFENNIIN